MTGDAIHDVGGIGEWLEIHAERRPRDATGKLLKHELRRQYGAASATAKG